MAVPPGTSRPVINAYGQGGFRISGRTFTGSVLILADHAEAVPAGSVAALETGDLAPLLQAEARPEFLLIGCGRSIAPLPAPVRQALAAQRIGVELMDTGAACRTYHVLAGEQRRVAALLIAI
ncbi:Mth938-like domain-containing protein [Desertibaculum subflavum]|uniref:Mth938-like domain-containing protein n=1 Tax=Desertibaculum subflavum TaxID=2268458 RepID=UPI000E66720E